MGMSTHIVAIRPPDEKWRKMKAARDACVAAGIEVPDEIDDYFDNEAPDEKGVLICLEIGEFDRARHPSIQNYQSDSGGVWDVDLDKLPPDTKILRFYNSW